MPQFTVDDEVAALVERLATRRPFEDLSFNDALRRVLQGCSEKPAQTRGLEELKQLLATPLSAGPKKAPSPSAADWASKVPELKDKKGLSTWKAICVLLKIDTAGDSARRRLKNWVKSNRQSWPDVPDV